MSNNKLHCLIYVSTTNYRWNEAELKILLDKARRFNKANEITGGLLLYQNKFIQILEGEKESIEKLYKKIILDSRHSNVLTLVNYEISARSYKDWSMAFKKVNSKSFKKLSGYVDVDQFVNRTISKGINNPNSFFLKLFYDKNVRVH